MRLESREGDGNYSAEGTQWGSEVLFGDVAVLRLARGACEHRRRQEEQESEEDEPARHRLQEPPAEFQLEELAQAVAQDVDHRFHDYRPNDGRDLHEEDRGERPDDDPEAEWGRRAIRESIHSDSPCEIYCR